MCDYTLQYVGCAPQLYRVASSGLRRLALVAGVPVVHVPTAVR